MNPVIYTAIINPQEPFGVNENLDKLTLSAKKLGVDCICFTNNDKLGYDDCEVIYVPMWNQDSVRTARQIKILPHKFLPRHYDCSVWVDGKVRVHKNPQKLLEKLLSSGKTFFARKHDKRDCVYAEAKHLIGLANTANFKDDPSVISDQMKYYREDGYPENVDLIASYVLMRNHNDKHLMEFEEKWWDLIQNYSNRDQLALPYSAWKTGYSYGHISTEDFNRYFRVSRHRIKNGKIRDVP